MSRARLQLETPGSCSRVLLLSSPVGPHGTRAQLKRWFRQPLLRGGTSVASAGPRRPPRPLGYGSVTEAKSEAGGRRPTVRSRASEVTVLERAWQAFSREGPGVNERLRFGVPRHLRAATHSGRAWYSLTLLRKQAAGRRGLRAEFARSPRELGPPLLVLKEGGCAWKPSGP